MAGSHCLFFIACLCLARDLVFCGQYEETGKQITLTPSIRGKPAEILWKHNGNKVVEYDGSELVEYGAFRGRVVVDYETGQIVIKDLNRLDSGEYQSDIVINGEIQTSSYTLTVLDVLAEPRVTCEPDERPNVKKLLCSVESQTQPSYEWSGPTIDVHSGPELAVDEPEENRDSVFTCTVKNQANSKSTSFNLKDCPTDGAGAAVIISVVIVTILLILLIVLAVILYKRKQKLSHSDVKNTDPENVEGQTLLNDTATRSMPGSFEATLPCHNRLPAQKESIADKNWDQGPQSFSETNQEDTGNENEREIEENKENNKRSVEGKENACRKPDETEKVRQNSLQSQDEEENKKSPILKQDGVRGENERLEEQKPEDNQKPGEAAKGTCGRDTVGEGQALLRDVPPDVMTGSFEAHNSLPTQKETNQEDTGTENEREIEENEENNEIPVKAKEIACSKADETEKGSQNSLQSQDEKENVKGPILKQEHGENERLEEQKPEDNDEDNQMPAEGIYNRDTAEPCDQPAVDEPMDSGDSPANVKETINSSSSSANPTDPTNNTDQNKEERNCHGLQQDEKEKVATDQEQKDSKEQMPEEQGHDPKISEETDEQTDPDSTIKGSAAEAQ